MTDAYNPFEHRHLKHPTNEVDSLIHLLKGSLGSGILGMAKAFQNGGLWFSLITTPIVGLICTHGVHMLIVSAHELYRRERVPMLDFGGVAEVGFKTGPKRTRVFANFAKNFVDVLMSLNLLGTCCIYLVFIARNLQQVVEYHGYASMDVRLYILCIWPFILLLIFVRDLKYLSPTSMIANVLIFVGMVISFYYMWTDVPDTATRDAIGSYDTVPLYFCTVVFALEGIGVVMPLENNMKDSSRFVGCPGVLNLGMGFVIVLYTAVGFSGYLKYGPNTMDAITLNLPTDQPLAQSVKIMMSVAIFFTYFLQFYVPLHIITKAIENRWGEVTVFRENILRFALSTLTVCLAIAVPTLEVFMSLVGALCLASLGLILPAAIETVVFWDTDGALGRGNWKIYKNVFVALVGVVALLFGTMSSIAGLVNFYREG